MYVDYIETSDEGHIWQEPCNTLSNFGGNPIFEKTCIKAMRNFVEVGCIKPEALEVMASFWRNVNIDIDTHWQDLRQLNIDFFEELDKIKLLHGDPNYLINNWLFPLYPLDLRLKRVNREELRKIQNNYYSAEWK